VGLALFHDTTATATVTQVDGVILPTKQDEAVSIQVFFNANDPAINSIRDAAEQPQVFLPRTDRAVDFAFRIKDAGFNNSLGWYNVGDDIFSAAGRSANLHPVFGCGVPMLETPTDTTRQHRGTPAHYVQNAAQGSTVSVNFAVERTAGRYKGGFIGLYLIAPEDNPSSQNCGDFKNDSGGSSLFGHIYYSQKDLNDDGDYVHHLVYTSVVNPELFYFGFEDSFRGNDNDFNDMFVSINGLRPPCVPTTEVCDGRDNDCDGAVDAADPDVTGIGDACLCDNAELPCSDGVVQGACQAGVTVCLAATIQCDARGAPTSETCDGVDQDCNGAIDDDAAGTGGTCDGGDEDSCLEGTIVCEAAQLVCTDTTGSTFETCNGNDDDCDSVTDENPSDEGDRCGTDTGLCVAGTEICMDGALECIGDVGPATEVCNRLDDDCDGTPDDNPSDATGPCDGTDVGECTRGTLVCAGGVVSCVGAQGPVTETCNSLDDDCNGTVDDDPVGLGQVCGEDRGECDPGRFVCTSGTLVCEGGDGPTAERCNGLDDDCNGTIDDEVIDDGASCDGGLMNVCTNGTEQCIAGTLQCVGVVTGTTEVCDGIDNDCDDLTDNGDLCGDGECIDGECTLPCGGGEFPCPIGQVCNAQNYCVPDPCAGITCPPGPAGELFVCDEGVCEAVCDDVTCSGSNVCRPTDGRCVPNNCEFLPLCEDNELCVDRECVSDPCAGVECGDAQFCRAGSCVASCAGVDCPTGEVCRDGTCAATGCSEDCPAGEICDPAMARCVDDPCEGSGAVRCTGDDVCDPTTGECIADPCLGVECPAGQSCDLGNCFAPVVPTTPDAGPRELVTPGGGGGCDAGGGSAPLLPVLAVLALVLLRRRGAVLAAVAAAALASQSACSVNEYCVSCGVGDDDGGVGDDDGGPGVDGPAIDARVDGPPPVDCDAGEMAEESCNALDDDCDGVVDEGFNLLDDPLNCGTCGTSCALDGTRTQCTDRQCVINGCAAGAVDVNGDIGGPFAESDGCEYSCFVSNGGNEVCDTLDNDCNGATDEGFDLQGDEGNCGVCGRVCSFFHATGTCTTGTCGFTAPDDCDAGYHDIDGMQGNGCEYSCTPTTPSTEVCDALDNNCNGTADEGFDTRTDPLNCGACGRACSFPGVVTPRCGNSACFFTRATDCAPGFVDLNNRQNDGCEYQCTVTGVESCDGADNDCNGLVDDNIPGAGIACASTPDGVPRGACTATGVVVCVASVGLVCDGAPQATLETCDGTDNDCDGTADDADGGGALTRTCYSGPDGTGNVGVCRRGTQTCTGGQFPAACTGEVLPGTETCNASDDDCDARVDENPSRTGPLSQECYTGSPGTEDVGVCRGGTQTCAGGAFGTCLGQVVNSPVDACGDDLDTDCDTRNDTAEGCLDVAASELRLDQASGTNGSNAGQNHSFDYSLAAGGSPLGSRLYAVWNDLGAGQADVFFRTSTDGGATWSTNIINITQSISQPAVEPVIVVAPGRGTGGADRIFVVYQTFTDNLRDIRVQRSNDNGATWAAIGGNGLDGSGDSFHHHAAVSSNGNTLAVTWERLNTTSFARDIQSRVTVNADLANPTFSTERTINQGSSTPARAGRPQVAITSTGRLVWVWREARDSGSAANGIFSAWSDTADGTLNARRLDGSTTPADAEPPQLVAVGQSTYVAWQDIATTAGQGSDILFVRSADNAASWSDERILDDAGGEVSSSFSPSMAVFDDGGTAGADRVAVAWEDRRSGVQAFVAVSSDGGTSFGNPVRASSQNGDVVPGQTLTPKLEFASASILVVAYVNDRAAGAFHVYATSSVDAGASWSVNDDLLDQGAGDALGPVVARALGGGFATYAVAVGWVDFRTNGERGDPYVRRTGR
jgi:Notch-like protein